MCAGGQTRQEPNLIIQAALLNRLSKGEDGDCFKNQRWLQHPPRLDIPAAADFGNYSMTATDTSNSPSMPDRSSRPEITRPMGTRPEELPASA